MGERRVGSLAAFKRGSRSGFLRDYGAFVCGVCECGVFVAGLGLTAQCRHLPRMRWWFLSMHLEFSSEIVDFNLR